VFDFTMVFRNSSAIVDRFLSRGIVQIFRWWSRGRRNDAVADYPNAPLSSVARFYTFDCMLQWCVLNICVPGDRVIPHPHVIDNESRNNACAASQR